MRLGSRLLLPLLAAVAAVMLLFAIWALHQRERRVIEDARRETHAYAIAMGLAIEAAFRDTARGDVQDLIDRLSRESTVYGVLIYDPPGRPSHTSGPLTAAAAAPADSVRRVFATAEEAAFERTIDGEQVYSVLRAVPDAAGRASAVFEVAQPLSELRTELGRTRERFLLNTLALLGAVTVLILWLVRELIGRPLERFVAAARALARGELAHRIEAPRRGGELAELAGEFNRMAAQIESAQHQLVREAEERLRLERRLRESEKMAAVGSLAAGLAHEIGAPLHVIRGRAEMLMKRQPLPEAHRRNLGIIVDQIGRITVIVRNLLDFARRREPRVHEIDLVPVVHGAAELLENEFEKTGITFAWSGPPRLEVYGDPDLLHQVFVNLFLNAAQALDAAAAGRIEVVGDRSDGEAVIEVRDNGPGIERDLLPRLFEPFFTTKPVGQGTGLGLAVAKSIAEEHGGRIEARNAEAGTGAVFRLTLPSAPSAAWTPDRSAPAAHARG